MVTMMGGNSGGGTPPVVIVPFSATGGTINTYYS
jgi:hypothetical protein